jgi:hypothetical protein
MVPMVLFHNKYIFKSCKRKPGKFHMAYEQRKQETQANAKRPSRQQAHHLLLCTKQKLVPVVTQQRTTMQVTKIFLSKYKSYHGTCSLSDNRATQQTNRHVAPRENQLSNVYRQHAEPLLEDSMRFSQSIQVLQRGGLNVWHWWRW